MADIVVYKGEDGKLAGFGERGERAWKRLLKAMGQLQAGETLEFKWWKPRSPGHHKLFFLQLHALFDRQEQFTDVDRLRTWLTVGAGECDLMPGPGGNLIALPRSIAWHRLDENAFSELHRAVDGFLWSDHARAYLWPHLSNEQTYEILETLRLQFSC